MILGVTDGFASESAINFLIVLSAAAVVSLALGKLRLASIPGYLIAGVLLGVVIDRTESVDQVNSIAVVLLMFGIGLHMDMHLLRGSAKRLVLAGVASGAIATIALLPIGMLLGVGMRASIGIAMALSLSSTAVVLRVLHDRRELRSSAGRLALSVLIVQDLAVIVMLAAVPLLASDSGVDSPLSGASLIEMGGKALVIIGAMGVLVVVGAVVVPRLIAAAAGVSSEVMLVISAALVLGAAMITSKLSLSPELGAFLAGMALAGTPFRYQLSGQLAPIRDLFLAVFFTSVGMTVDHDVLAQHWWVVLIATPLVLVIKTVAISLGCWAVGMSAALTLGVGVMLAQGGEFSLVVIAVLNDKGVIAEPARSILISTIVATLIVTPYLIGRARQIGVRLGSRIRPAPWAHRAPDEIQATADSADDRPLVLVLGYGPVGRAVVERLAKDLVQVSIVELNARTVRRQRAIGLDAHFGDASNGEVLRSAGVERARVVVVTIPDDEVMLRICRVVRSLNTEACLVIRAGTLGRGLLAMTLGANHAVVEEVAAAKEMSDWVFVELGRYGRKPPDIDD